MPTTGGIKAGRAYVEMGLNDRSLVGGLARAEARLKAFGNSIKSLGKQLVGFGVAAALPLGAATKQFAGFDDAMANLRANANPTAEELRRIEAAVKDISRSTGAGPTQVAETMTELLKAGLGVEEVINGAADATLRFARIAGMEAAPAATTLVKAMNVFGVDAVTAADAMSKAADASTVSVEDVAMSFSQVSAAASMAGLDIHETANAIAILGQNAVVGSDAGTSLKTMLLRLVAPVDEGAKRMAQLGIGVRDASGEMKPLRDVIAELQSKLGRLNVEARDQAMRELFGSDAIRAGIILVQGGVEAWDEFNGKIADGLSVSRKHAIVMDTLSGFTQMARSALEEAAIAVGATLAPTLRKAGVIIARVSKAFVALVEKNPELVKKIALVTAGVVAGGAALIALGGAASFAAAAIAVLVSPLGLVVAGVVALVAFTKTGQSILRSFAKTATEAFEGITNALESGNVALAGKIFWKALDLEWIKGTKALRVVWNDALEKMLGTFGSFVDTIVKGFLPILNVAGVDIGGNIDAVLKRVGLDQEEARKRFRGQGIETLISQQMRAEKELKDLLDEARGAPPPIPNDIPGKATPGRKPTIFGEDLGRGIDAVARKVEVFGSFGGGVIGQQGFGSSIENDQLKELKLGNQLLGSINRKIETPEFG